jgi:hypothetical protein
MPASMGRLMIYLDTPIAKSRVFHNGMRALGVDWHTHVPAGKDGNRVTVRARAPFNNTLDARRTTHLRDTMLCAGLAL